jgi:hypothetical protein
MSIILFKSIESFFGWPGMTNPSPGSSLRSPMPPPPPVPPLSAGGSFMS